MARNLALAVQAFYVKKTAVITADVYDQVGKLATMGGAGRYTIIHFGCGIALYMQH